ncbi:hypothetical protein BRADI_3g38591v3 [Brachypodium distachyon]|uniref:Uncharacterized protein n=1 Tax=Brachypodium distachyon TaxID=15368 RepID=A0A2K2D1Z7_BRADI|nr:hypothetical protein BRADI_3g38591v3 [Brachypodium distachyon]
MPSLVDAFSRSRAPSGPSDPNPRLPRKFSSWGRFFPLAQFPVLNRYLPCQFLVLCSQITKPPPSQFQSHETPPPPPIPHLALPSWLAMGRRKRRPRPRLCAGVLLQPHLLASLPGHRQSIPKLPLARLRPPSRPGTLGFLILLQPIAPIILFQLIGEMMSSHLVVS